MTKKPKIRNKIKEGRLEVIRGRWDETRAARSQGPFRRDLSPGPSWYLRTALHRRHSFKEENEWTSLNTVKGKHGNFGFRVSSFSSSLALLDFLSSTASLRAFSVTYFTSELAAIPSGGILESRTGHSVILSSFLLSRLA